MLKNLFNKLENPARPLLGPNVHALQFWGLLLPNNFFKRYFYITMHILVTIFTATEYVDIWFIKNDMNMVLDNLKITMLATMSVFKITTFLFWQNQWKSIIDYVTNADLAQRNTSDVINKDIITSYTKYCRRITYFYWCLMYTTVLIVILQPVVKFFNPVYRQAVDNGSETYLQVVSSWVPFAKNTVPGYLAASVYQTYAAIYGGGWITSFDTNAIVIMIFFKGELELLRRDSANIFGSKYDFVQDEVVMLRLKDCHRRHTALVKYARLFDSCLSPIMLFYMFVCSVMLCVTAYQITNETSVMQRFLTTEYLVFGIAQLFLYCWHSNDVLYTSQHLMLGPFESTWTSNFKRRKDLYILIEQYRKAVVFTAGPFTQLTIPTFVAILKGAYSYYTLLGKSQSK